MFVSKYPDYHKINVAELRTGLILASTEEQEVGDFIGEKEPFLQATTPPQILSVDVIKHPPNDKPYLVFRSAILTMKPASDRQENFRAVVSLYVDTEEFLRPMLGAVWGMGETSDIVLVNGERRILMPLKYRLADGTLSRVLEYQIEADPARLAVARKEGVVAARDYRGVPVLAAYRTIMVTPDVRWGMVVKHDQAEVFGPMWQGLLYSSLVGLGGIVVALLIMVRITTRIVRPIEDLSETARRVEEGDLNARAPVTRCDEVGTLAETFNSMVERVRRWHVELEEQVKTRTVQLSQEIEQRKQTEQELSREREWLGTTLRSIGAGVISTDTQGNVLSVNQMAETLTGWSEEEAVGRPLEEIFLIINAKNRQPCENPVQKVLESGHIVGLANDTVLIGRNGTERVLADSGAPIRTDKGDIEGVVLAFRDVTERKRAEEALRESEEKYRILVQTAHEGIHVVQDGIFKFLNPTLVEIYGHSEEELLTRPFAEFIHPDDREMVLDRSLRQARGEEVPSRYAHRVLTKDGRTKWVEIDSAAISWKGKPAVLVFTSDVTEHKQMEEAIKERDAQYRNLVEESFDGIMVTKETKITFVNSSLCQMLGYSKEELEGMDYRQLPHPDFSDAAHERALARMRGESVPSHYELKFQRKDGSAFEGEIHSRAVEIRGAPGVQVWIRDITERKNAEESLRQSEERYRATFNNAAVGIDLVDSDLRLLEANDTLLDFLGYTRAELSNLTIYDVTHPADIESTRTFSHAIVRGDAEDFRLEKRYVRKDGSVVWADTSVSAIRDQAGQYVASVGVIVDITSRKKSEEARVRLATAIEQAAEAILITDSEGTIAYANPAFENTTGYSRQEAIGANPRILSSGQHDAGFYANMWQTISSGKVWSGHLINRKKDGTFFEEEATISPVKDDSGRIVNYVAVKRDVTKEVVLQKQLIQAQKMEAVGTLAGGIAHDFNNLLTIILGFAELVLMDMEEDNPSRADIQKIIDSAYSGASLVQRLLTYSRHGETSPGLLDVRHEIEQVRELLSRTIPRMISLEVSLADDVAPIYGDSTQIQQVVMNLALNAADAMQDGGKLTIEAKNCVLDDAYCATRPGVKPGDHVLLTVSDTGQGMGRQLMERMYDPFFSTKQRGSDTGTGLGLAIVHSIVEQHRGHMTCDSAPGKGTRFELYFPAMTTETHLEDVQEKVAALGGTETILLVDDDEFIRDLGKRILSRAGYKVLTACNGREALDIYRKEMGKISLVVLDIVMPVMGGRQCIPELSNRSESEAPRFHRVSSEDDEGAQAISTFPFGFIRKPFAVSRLLQAVREIIDKE